jgi:hypothetical protein
MVFNDPIQIDQIAIDVIEHLDIGWRFHEVKRGTAREWFGVALMLREQRKNPLCKAAFTADPGDDWFGHVGAPE